MDIIDAIDKRISCRAFTDEPLDAPTLDALKAKVEELNKQSGLHFQIYGPDSEGFVISMNRAMFAGDPPAYAALVGPTGDIEEEKLGYFGEALVLYATELGLGTCWVASTYDKATTRVELASGEELHDVVPIGFAPEKMPFKQRTIRNTIRRKSKKLSDLFEGPMPLDQAPEWIQACIDAVWKAPSAINMQPVKFTWEGEGTPVKAVIAPERTRLEPTDLGIAKYHFKVVADLCGVHGTWEWGNGGAYVLDTPSA